MIRIDRNSKQSIYLQISNTLIQEISKGTIASGLKLPGTRTMAELLAVNRRTVIIAYDELAAQGWVELKPQKGCFVSSKIPILKSKTLTSPMGSKKDSQQLGFELDDRFDFLKNERKPRSKDITHIIDDGHPDVRLAPLKALGKNVSYLMGNPQGVALMNYRQSFRGDVKLREQITQYLSETRSIQVSAEDILITRGSLMAFYLFFQALLSPNDVVITSDLAFNEGLQSIRLAKGKSSACFSRLGRNECR